MKQTKLFQISILAITLAIVFAGCGSGNANNQPDTSDKTDKYAEEGRILEVSDEHGFPSVLVDDGKDFIFDYRVTRTRLVDEIEDQKLETKYTSETEGGKLLVVEFSAVNRSRATDYGNTPLFKIEYNGNMYDSNAQASVAEEENQAISEYSKTTIRSKHKGKYVKVFDLGTTQEDMDMVKFIIDYKGGAATGEIEVKLNSGEEVSG